MRQQFRDKTRDELADAVNALGVRASLIERGTPLENHRKPTWARALGAIDLTDGPIQSINVFKRDGSRYSAPKWWAVLYIPDERPLSGSGPVSVKTVRKRSFPRLWKIVDVTWIGEDGGASLLRTLTNDQAVRRMAISGGDVEIERAANDDFPGWIVTIHGKFAPSNEQWGTVQQIIAYVLESHSG